MTVIDHGFTVKCDSCEWTGKFTNFDGDLSRNDPGDFGGFSGEDEEIFTCEECLKKLRGAQPQGELSSRLPDSER
mgnify:CR=1 FL=1